MRFLDLQPRAILDLEEHADYYAAISLELVDAFLGEADVAIAYLLENAATGSNRYAHLLDGRLKRWQLDRFPFAIFYLYDAQTLQIVRVLHERMDFASRHFR